MEPDLDRRRWRLLWLLFASLAMPVWWAAVFAPIYDAEDRYLPEIVGLCFPPAVGAVIGYYAAHHYRLRHWAGWGGSSNHLARPGEIGDKKRE